MNARERILEAADELFGLVGFEAATTREIAERCGVNKALIHYHFKTKECLFETLLDRYYAGLAATLEGALKRDGSLREKMLGLVDAYVDFLADNLNFSRIVQREAAGGRHMNQVLAQMTPLFDMGTRLLREAYPGTRQGEMEAAQILVSFYGMIISYFTYRDLLRHLLGTAPLSRKNLELRKKHLRRMAEITLDEVERG